MFSAQELLGVAARTDARPDGLGLSGGWLDWSCSTRSTSCAPSFRCSLKSPARTHGRAVPRRGPVGEALWQECAARVLNLIVDELPVAAGARVSKPRARELARYQAFARLWQSRLPAAGVISWTINVETLLFRSAARHRSAWAWLRAVPRLASWQWYCSRPLLH